MGIPNTELKEVRIAILHDRRPIWKRIFLPFSALCMSVEIERFDGTLFTDTQFTLNRGEGIKLKFLRSEDAA